MFPWLKSQKGHTRGSMIVLIFCSTFFVCHLQITESPIGNLRKILGNKILFCLFFMILSVHLVTVRIKKKDTILCKKVEIFYSFSIIFFLSSLRKMVSTRLVTHCHYPSLLLNAMSMIHWQLWLIASCGITARNLESWKRKLKNKIFICTLKLILSKSLWYIFLEQFL